MKKIIHVDNSEFFRKLMHTFLTGEGFEVESFSKGEEASFYLSGGSTDMVICGLSLEDMDGEIFLKRIMDFYDGPVVVISGSLDASSQANLKSLRVIASIEKSGSWKESLRTYLLRLK